MCHGIPDSWQFQDGDIINIDVSVYLNGYHGDTSKTFICGNVTDEVERLVKVTEECIERGISICKDGVSFKKIEKRIRKIWIASGRAICGAWSGYHIPSQPTINHRRNEEPGVMVENQAFTIEPIFTMGSIECVTWPDNWTTLTADGAPAAQFEHAILITRRRAEILTKF